MAFLKIHAAHVTALSSAAIRVLAYVFFRWVGIHNFSLDLFQQNYLLIHAAVDSWPPITPLDLFRGGDICDVLSFHPDL